MVGVPIVVFVVCLTVGVAVSAQCLPDLAVGSVGGVAFVVVCGLLGAALGLVGLHTYSLVEELNSSRGAVSEGEIVADVVRNILFQAGSLVGLAMVVYLLAPPPSDAAEQEQDSTG